MQFLKNQQNLYCVFLVGIAFFLVGIDHAPVPSLDGAIRASMARSILETDQWWPPIFDHEVLIDHPPLFIWLTALSFKIFGTMDFAFHLVPRVAALLLIMTTFFIALELGMSTLGGLISALVLCSTRDFILSSVRGYIEPLLSFWIYLGLLCLLVARRSIDQKKIGLSFLSGLCVFLAFFSKGPVALWPLLFFAFFLMCNRDFKALLAYSAAIIMSCFCFTLWIYSQGHAESWSVYLHDQVLNSALKGRNGAQGNNFFYFLNILLRYYWPWLPLLILSVHGQFFKSKQHSPASLVLLFGLGFVAGFSIVKWKFWYYIAPAYPAFALAIAKELTVFLKDKVSEKKIQQFLFAICGTWIGLNAFIPLKLYRERTPEIMAFKDVVRQSPVKGPIWYVRGVNDFNLINTNGFWYFHRSVREVTPDEEMQWHAQRAFERTPAWVLTTWSGLKQCELKWCKGFTAIAQTGDHVLGLLFFTDP